MHPRPHPSFRAHLRPLLAAPAAFLAAVLATSTVGAAPAVANPDDAGASHTSVSLSAADSDPARTATLSLDEGVHVLGLRWEGPQPEAAQLRVREPGASWGAWTDLDEAVAIEPFAADATADAPADASRDVSEAPIEDDQTAPRGTLGDVVVGAAEVQVRLVGEASDASLEAWTTYRTPEDVAAVHALPITSEEVAIGTRADWSADESMRDTYPRYLIHETPKLGVTVHHTAGINNYGQTDVPSIIRGIFYYHGQTLGWGDIGYATLVDKYGRTWEGRAGGVEENIQLAHAFGMNRDWAGISVLGNHQTAQVWRTELVALSELTAWTLDTHGVMAGTTVDYTNGYEGWTRTLPVVHGHRDVNETSCPGLRLYALMDTLRSWVAVDQAESSDAVQRIGGDTRYAVSAQMARDAFLEGTRTAYLVSGEGLPDALGVGAVADAAGAAVLLTRPRGLPAETLAALDHLGVEEVTIVGGKTSVPQRIVDELSAHGYAVTRVAGKDRYETAAHLTAQTTAPGRTVYVANGVSLVDALGGSAAAAELGGAVVLTRPTSLPSATAEALSVLAPSRVVILGGDTAVAPAVADQIETLLPAVEVERIGGHNRYATSALLATDAFDYASSTVVASGDAPVDAMVGTQLAARHDGPVLLTRSSCRPASVDTAYQTLGITFTRLAGGAAVVDWPAGHTVCS